MGDPCQTTRRCPQCWKAKPVDAFWSASSARLVQKCSECRARYGNWERLSPAERLSRMRVMPRAGNGLTAKLTPVSFNRKTGPIPVSMTDPQSCPPSCAFLGAGCYAEHGNTRMHWARIARRGDSWEAFCASVAALPAGTLWRHNEAGDLPGAGEAVDAGALLRLVHANRGRRGFTFSHKPVGRRTALERANAAAIRHANARGLTINLSANSLRHADELAGLGIGPVAVVLPVGAPARLLTPGGRRVIACLNETKGLTCLECRLCAVAGRKSIVGFRAHGAAKHIVSALVTLRLKKGAGPRKEVCNEL